MKTHGLRDDNFLELAFEKIEQPDNKPIIKNVFQNTNNSQNRQPKIITLTLTDETALDTKLCKKRFKRFREPSPNRVFVDSQTLKEKNDYDSDYDLDFIFSGAFTKSENFRNFRKQKSLYNWDDNHLRIISNFKGKKRTGRTKFPRQADKKKGKTKKTTTLKGERLKIKERDERVELFKERGRQSGLHSKNR